MYYIKRNVCCNDDDDDDDNLTAGMHCGQYRPLGSTSWRRGRAAVGATPCPALTILTVQCSTMVGICPVNKVNVILVLALVMAVYHPPPTKCISNDDYPNISRC